jgi:AraC-like DNA-binding protein/quercetin dioxygenase-like cupin family protein
VYDNTYFGYTKVTVETALVNENGEPILKKGKFQPSKGKTDTETIPLEENIAEYLKENVKHGTDEYAYAQYDIKRLQYSFYMPYHWHNEIEIIYIHRGRLNVVIDGVEYEGKEGGLYLVNPSQMHMMYTDDLQVEYYTLLYDLELLTFEKKSEFDRELTKIWNEEVKLGVDLSKYTLYKKILGRVQKIVTLNKEKELFYKLDTRLNILRIMQMLIKQDVGSAHVDENYNIKNGEVKKQIISYIEENYTSKITLSDISEVVHMSEKYFSRFFKENFGINFVDYVNRIRLEKAASMLLSTDEQVTEIALACGYTNISYFIRSFKKAFGTSPHAFRRG